MDAFKHVFIIAIILALAEWADFELLVDVEIFIILDIDSKSSGQKNCLLTTTHH